ncbi:MAG: uroporphyrinogen-III synthase [Rhodospirillales bacterium]|nr:uroporphyrinogen-III synthase [Rhodospirillales bacterium]
MTGSILITRPEEDAQALADAVRALGLEPFCAPMLEIVPLPVTLPDLSAYQALVLTSANGARALARLSEDRSLPVYCTGDHTAEIARGLGWTHVSSAGGDAGDLMALIGGAALDPAWPLLHVCGADVARPVVVPGLDIVQLPVYKANQINALDDELLARLDRGEIAAALFFSARTAACFAGLLEQAGRAQDAESIKSLCLADSVVKSLRHLRWAALLVADRPDRTGMLDLLQQVFSR